MRLIDKVSIVDRITKGIGEGIAKNSASMVQRLLLLISGRPSDLALPIRFTKISICKNFYLLFQYSGVI